MKKIALAAFSATALLALSACGDAAEDEAAVDETTVVDEAAPVEPVAEDTAAAADAMADDAAAAGDAMADDAAADDAAAEAPTE